MSDLMPWLPAAPPDVRARCSAPDVSVRTLLRLVACDLNEQQLRSVVRAWDRLDPMERAKAGLSPFRLGILSNATTDLLQNAIRGTALRHGIDITVEIGAFDQILAQALDASSSINKARCDAVLLAIDHRIFPTADPSDNSGVDEVLDMLRTTRDALHANSGAASIFATLPAPVEPVFGSFDAVLDGTGRALATALNDGLRTLVRQSKGDFLFDVAAVANGVGLSRWHDPIQWNVAKLAFAQEFLPLYADHLMRIIAAARGKSRKCLVLDLDNTLWGGVIGDDGLSGLVLGNGTALGEAFLDIQRTALKLRERGVVLAVCSKNDDSVARNVFRNHPEMLLREEHIAAFVANWTDKATNLETIAEQLSIGIDSLVFLDDNPAERAQVRQTLPQVAVPELPDDPSFFTRILLNAGYFEAVAFSEDDRKRAMQYQDNQARATLRAATRDMGAYLKSLEMLATVSSFDAVGRARIAQLINKSNQFNLTTRRYTEAQVMALETEKDTVTLQVRLQDRFGDNGIVCIVIARADGRNMVIDTWLMSCRVLGRELEQAVLNELVERSRKHGAEYLLGLYRPTSRNDMVKDHYSKLGFVFDGEDETDGGTRWRLDVAAFEQRPTQISIKSEEFATQRAL